MENFRSFCSRVLPHLYDTKKSMSSIILIAGLPRISHNLRANAGPVGEWSEWRERKTVVREARPVSDQTHRRAERREGADQRRTAKCFTTRRDPNFSPISSLILQRSYSVRVFVAQWHSSVAWQTQGCSQCETERMVVSRRLRLRGRSGWGRAGCLSVRVRAPLSFF